VKRAKRFCSACNNPLRLMNAGTLDHRWLGHARGCPRTGRPADQDHQHRFAFDVAGGEWICTTCKRVRGAKEAR
jgi:hypothetical protein